MKVLAMYLPQYYRVKENDEWWGEGFTDWISAKNAKPLSEGHYQPHIPMNDNYYDLIEKDTMIWQADLMNKYGIDGMCIYHYWFKDGKKLLEKPAENLLEWQDIDFPFCFCWANETWARSWGNIKGANIWSRVDEPQKKGKEILVEQSYGTYDQWKNHFDYLAKFFKDQRYIKYNNSPLFVIYKPNDILCLSEMLIYWNKLARRIGFNGIYVIGANCFRESSNYLDAYLYHEPPYTRDSILKGKKRDKEWTLEYKEVWDNILKRKAGRKTTIFGGFSNYDDTPRQGCYGGYVRGESPELFEKYIYELMVKNAKAGNAFTFVNAWNEWGEGMHLEPDEKYKYAFLEALKNAKETFDSMLIDCPAKDEVAQATIQQDETEIIIKEKNKYELYLNTLHTWMSLQETGLSVSDYLSKHGYRNILVYGYGIFGKHLLREFMHNEDINIVGLVDKNISSIDANVNGYLDSDEWPECDLVVITPFFFKDEILINQNFKKSKGISIDYIIKELSNNCCDIDN